MLDNPGLLLSVIARGLDELSAPVSATIPCRPRCDYTVRGCFISLDLLLRNNKFATVLAKRQYWVHVDLQSRQAVLFYNLSLSGFYS